MGRTIRKHFKGVLTAVETGLTNARLEGVNNKIRLIGHRAYGFHSSQALIAMVYLCCTKIDLQLDHTSPAAGAIFAVSMLVSTEKGECFSVDEVGRWMRKRGLWVEEAVAQTAKSSLIVGIRTA